MGALRLEKRGLRGLAIAESFAPGAGRSVLSGVVMRRDFVIDGFVFGWATVGGDDATDAIVSMHERLRRPDVGYLLVSGMVISGYNVVDMGRLHGELGVPVIGVSYGGSGGIGGAIRGRFPSSCGPKLAAYGRLGPRTRVRLRTSGEVFVRAEGCGAGEAARLLDGLTLQGSVPEPVRVCRLLSRALLAGSPL